MAALASHNEVLLALGPHFSFAHAARFGRDPDRGRTRPKHLSAFRLSHT